MPEERNRPPSQKPDTAALIQQLFRDVPEEELRDSPAGPESPVGVVAPPGEPAPESPAPPSAGGPSTVEGLVEAPPAPEGQGGEGEAEEAGRPPGARWYVIHTYSGYENKVRTNLERRVASMGMQGKIFRILVPTEDEIEIKDGKRRIAKKKVWMTYHRAPGGRPASSASPSPPWPSGAGGASTRPSTVDGPPAEGGAGDSGAGSPGGATTPTGDSGPAGESRSSSSGTSRNSCWMRAAVSGFWLGGRFRSSGIALHSCGGDGRYGLRIAWNSLAHTRSRAAM